MYQKILLLSLIALTSSAATVSLPTNVSTYLQNMNYFNDPHGNITEIADLINGALKSLNLSDIEVNIILNRIDDSQLLVEAPNDINNLKEFEKSLAYLFKTAVNTNWYMKYFLYEIARATNNIKVYEILFEILLQQLKNDENKANPFVFLEIYNDLESVLNNLTSDKLIRLHNEIQTAVVLNSVQILQSFFMQHSTIRTLVAQLKLSNNLYEITIPRLIENINSIEDQWLIARNLLEFDTQTQEAVFNHITYLKYLKSHNKVIPQRLYENLEMLIARSDFVNISLTQRQISAKLLPLSMGNLFAAEKICLRNATTNFYLYECPQTYLMCTSLIANNINPINRKKAAFNIERIGNDQYNLHSPYWGRYFHLQNNTSKNMTLSINPNSNTSSSNTNILKITKNLYSHAEASSWLIRFEGNYATIQDPTHNLYVCGGDSSHWSNMEKYAYTRQSKDFDKKANECLWLLEDCSDVV